MPLDELGEAVDGSVIKLCLNSAQEKWVTIEGDF